MAKTNKSWFQSLIEFWISQTQTAVRNFLRFLKFLGEFRVDCSITFGHSSTP